MNHTQTMQDAAACLKQFQHCPTGRSAQDIASAEGIPVARCSTILDRLAQAQLIHAVDEGRFRLSGDVTALDVLNAVWTAPAAPDFHMLFGTRRGSAKLVRQLSRREWAQG